jgi:transcriptional regulator with XRE-family HTH domain
MSNGGKRLNELIRERGFRISAVAEAIGINRVTIGAWTDNAPIGKLVKLSKFTGISIDEIIHCLVEENSLAQSLHEKSESE